LQQIKGIRFLNQTRFHHFDPFIVKVGQLAFVEPASVATGAFMDIDLAARIQEDTLQLDAFAARASPRTGGIDSDVVVIPRLKKQLAESLAFTVDLLHLERIKPDPPTTALADPETKAPNLFLGQIAGASGTLYFTFHRLANSITTGASGKAPLFKRS
jgi:hypothetical protein